MKPHDKRVGKLPYFLGGTVLIAWGAIANAAAPQLADQFVKMGPFSILQDQVTQNSTDITNLYGITDQNTLDISTLYDVTSQNSADISALYDVTSQNSADISTLYNVTGQNSADISALYNITDNLTLRVDKLYGITDQMRKDISVLQNNLVALTKRVSQNSDYLMSLSMHVNTIYKTLLEHDSRLDALRADLTSLQSDVAGNAAAIDAINVEIASLQAQIAENEAESNQALAELEKKLSIQSAALAELRNLVDQQFAWSTVAINNLHVRINELTDQLAANQQMDKVTYNAIMLEINKDRTSISQLSSSLTYYSHRLSDLEYRFNTHTHDVLGQTTKCDIIGFINPLTPIFKCYNVWTKTGETTTTPHW